MPTLDPITDGEVAPWLTDVRQRFYTRPTRIPLAEVALWEAHPGVATIRHESGRFFDIHGLAVAVDGVLTWRQPVVYQNDIGVLGLLMAERDGELQVLVQAKPEPGNINGVQISTTVQATHSNYTRVHGGRPVPYLDYFANPAPHQIVVDTRQSEHGAVFFRKRNRNIVVQVAEPPAAQDGFCWLPLSTVYRLLAVDDLLSMDLRTVLGCLPWVPEPAPTTSSPFQHALHRSMQPDAPARHRLPDLLHWITDTRCRHRVDTTRLSLPELPEWRHVDGVLSAGKDSPFHIIGVSVEAAGREVQSWSQPMIEVPDPGVLALLVADIEGVLHLLVQLRIEPGLIDVAELAPSVQQLPGTPEPSAAEAELLIRALSASPQDIRFDTMLSEEGGRFFHTRNRHLIVETAPFDEPTGYRWITVAQLRELLRHSYYANVQTRSLLSCLTSLLAEPAPGGRC